MLPNIVYNEYMKKVFFVVTTLLFFLFFSFVILAKEISQMSSEEVEQELASSRKELSTKDYNSQSLLKKLNEVNGRITQLGQEIIKKEKEVKDGEEALDYQKNLLNERAKSYYKNINRGSLNLLTVLTSNNLSESLRGFFYQQSLVDKDKNTIIKVVLYIKNLEEIKISLEKEKNQLSALKSEADSQFLILQGEITEIKQKIAQLSARQQQLISQRLAALNISRSAGTSTRGCSDDRSVDPGFSPRLAFFTFGAPHRNGLNQYGAWGRAKAGQNEEQILQEYYPNMNLKKDYDQGIQITTTTGWSGSIEEYVKRIYEVPDSWTENNLAVLKAQAVAARTYALKVTENGAKQICTSEQCQVFKDSPKGGNWDEAVRATAGWVLMDGGGPGFTQYASTHGGYIQNLSKFDGNGSHNNFSELQSNAYDKESPWFYCDWGARGNYYNTAWLKPAEVADIANVILLARINSSAGDHLYQVDKPHPYGGENWNEERVRQELKNNGINPFSNVYDISISADFNSGKTNSISLSGDGKSDSFGGDEFKNWFNLRAPGNIQIVGPLFNVEKR
ncbi:MAG: peptidase M23B [Candidatus Daviesbacteria bacterium GW2011_GWC1_40_9]|nr:MAG: peptidase M23B [Candidatus Daviesbacteria bacterium GW2011_GWC1_40_9]